MSFDAFGLRPELLEALSEQEFTEPTPLQKAAIPILRRGSNAVLQGSSGAGIATAYGVAILDRLMNEPPLEGGGARMLVVVPTDQSALRVGTAIAALALRAGLRVTTLAPDWAHPAQAEVIVATPRPLEDAVRRSAVKLESLQAVVLDGIGALLSLEGADALDSLLSAVPREAQRVITAAEADAAVEHFVERHVRRAMWIPPRPQDVGEAPPTTTSVRYTVVGDTRKTSLLARLLAERSGMATLVLCRNAQRARRLARELDLRGFGLGEAVAVSSAPAEPEQLANTFVVSYDVPFDAEALRARHERGGLILCEPAELAHLRRIASDAAVALTAQDALPEPRRTEVDRFRERLRTAIRDRDLGAEMLVIEPLLAEFSAAEVAAAASALLRDQRAQARAAAQTSTAEAAPDRDRSRTWVRLFVSVGSRDGVRTGDLLGAMTGEAHVTAEDVGRIELRDTFALVEVASHAAEKVIRALNGTSLRGRSMRVDLDRRSRPEKPRGDRRRTVRRT